MRKILPFRRSWPPAIAAAGKGTRLLSEEYNIPKVLRKANGKPLISYVLENLSFIDPEDIYIVEGYKKEMVKEEIRGRYVFVDQDEQLGTGHAVMMAEKHLKDYDGDVLITYGDMPLISRSTYRNILNEHKRLGSKCTIITCSSDKKLAYGRILRNAEGKVRDIVEQKDCSPEQLAIEELNVGIHVYESRLLFESLKLIKNDNTQHEYYLTDVPKILINKGIRVNTCNPENQDEIYGINAVEDLELCDILLREGK
jgi:UDP-N-acetylglucosamine diphosphorylase/glucosamine-1-phosphate N-acetyltransferase